MIPIRSLLFGCLAAAACSSPARPAAAPAAPASPPVGPAPAQPPAVPAEPAPVTETLAADTPRTTVRGATFIAPAGWTVTVRGPATILAPPEGDSHIALVDVEAGDADAAVAKAWAAYRPDAAWKLDVATPAPDKDGWQDQRNYRYVTSPDEQRDVEASAMRHDTVWTVAIYDMKQATGQKRLAQVTLIFGRLLPAGYQRESFAGKPANRLDAQRIAALGEFVEAARAELQVPGVAVGLIQDGKVVFAGGFGVRELGKKQPVDADTLFIIASNTKAMTTLMLARLVDQGKLTWDTPVTDLLPTFRLADPEVTRQVRVKHLVCACTGLPRQDLEWLINFEHATPASEMSLLGSVRPTSKFGEMYQYSNLLAAAGGFVGGFVVSPERELGAAYDRAMATLVFGPLGMKATTFDFARALRGNHAAPHALDIDGKVARVDMAINYSIVPLRPAGGAWSNVRDVLRYLAVELARGTLADGSRYVSEQALLARRLPQVTIGEDATYGMGLAVDTTYGVPVVHHGGSMLGYKTDMIFLPDHQVGAVILTNSDAGGALLGPFRRRLLEILFDGTPEAAAQVAATARAMKDQIAAERKRLTVPADPAEAAKLAARYGNAALGDLLVTRSAGATTFTISKLRSPVASRRNPDGTTSFLTIAPGVTGLELVAGADRLVLHDAQHDYTFTPEVGDGGQMMCGLFGTMGFGGRTSPVSEAVAKADEKSNDDVAAAVAAADKKQYAAAARHWLACARRYRGLDDDVRAPACFYNALHAYASAGRLAAEGRAALLRAAKDDPHNARQVEAELAVAPDDCPVK